MGNGDRRASSMTRERDDCRLRISRRSTLRALVDWMGRDRMRTKFIVIVIAVLGAACVQKGSTTETTSVADLKSYKACAVQLDETGMKNGPKAKQVVMEELRSKLSADGTCEVKDDGD